LFFFNESFSFLNLFNNDWVFGLFFKLNLKFFEFFFKNFDFFNDNLFSLN